MDLTAVVFIQILNMIASLALISVGLAIIFGMMRVINLAHGEFLMLGAYTVLVTTKAGVNVWVAMLVIAPVFVGLVGVVVERFLIRFLYGRMMDTMLATWGLSLLIIGVMTTIFGNTMEGISTPLGSFRIGEITESRYKLFLIAITGAMLGLQIQLTWEPDIDLDLAQSALLAMMTGDFRQGGPEERTT